MELFLGGGLILGKALLLSAIWFLMFLPAANPWIGVLVDEPYTLYAANRFILGEIPYRDFFFLWTPGVIYLHALIHSLTHEWVFSGRLFLIFVGLFLLWRNQQMGKAVGLSKTGQKLVWLAALVWGIPQWNQPYSSWYAIALLFLAEPLLGKKNFFAGITIAFSFWFKQNIGIYGVCAAVIFFLSYGSRRNHFRFFLGLCCGIVPGLLYFFFKGALGAFLKQTIAFPFIYKEVMSFSIRDVALFDPTKGIFYTLTLLAFPWLILALWRNRGFFSENHAKILLFTGAGFLQIYPRFDFTHFVFSFICAAVPLVWAIEASSRRIRQGGRFLLVILLLAGVYETGARLYDTWTGKSIFGLRGNGFIYEYLKEIESVTKYLQKEGFQINDPVLQIPVTTAFYLYSGFRNGTPHNQFFPMYAETFGEHQVDILNRFIASGGRFVVLDRNAKVKEYVPELMTILERDFFEVKRFPLSFSVWAVLKR